MSNVPATPTAPEPTQTPVKEPAKTSPVRMGILLALFALVVGLLAYDFLVAKPRTEKAEKAIDALFAQRNAQGVRKSEDSEINPDYVKPADIQKLLNKKPMWTRSSNEKGNEHLAECYWWGVMPHRNFIWVMYHGSGEHLRFNSQHRDSKPDPAEDYPNSNKANEPASKGSPDATPPTTKEQAPANGDTPDTDKADKPAEEKPAAEKADEK